ncbi:YibE/F family protein [Demequina oxidasica]|uniref:YibE/F family protein n=1 Tax=Demequina oxidasica TaxID=676199 RepID=UPI00128C4717|nr:YibE/F family protein [Demequina oxidasica]
MHSHSDAPPRASRRTSLILGVLVGIIGVAVAVGAALTWPTNLSTLGSEQLIDDDAAWVIADVVSVHELTGEITVDIATDGESVRDTVQPSGVPGMLFDAGDKIRVLQLPDGSMVFSDFDRTQPMLLLLAVYVLAVLLVARWRGAGALLGLGIAFGIVVFYAVPSLLDGNNPVVVGLVTGAGSLFALLYIAHGINARTTTAYLGTIAGLAVTALIGVWAVAAANIPGVPSDAELSLVYVNGNVELRGLALCGLMLAGLGILNDVTVTQASAAWELRAARPDLSRYELFKRTMRIGRDHIASTVYTFAFAYVGASLPLIMIVLLYDEGAETAVTSSEVAGEIVRTLVGSIGLVLAVPLTTAIAALVVGSRAVQPQHDEVLIDEPFDHDAPVAPGERR